MSEDDASADIQKSGPEPLVSEETVELIENYLDRSVEKLSRMSGDAEQFRLPGMFEEALRMTPEARTAQQTSAMRASMETLVETAIESLTASQTAIGLAKEQLVRAEASLKLAEAAREDAKVSATQAAEAESRAARIGFWSMILTGASLVVALGALVVTIIQVSG